MLVQVKENQPSLLRIIERISRTDTALSSSESFDDKKRSREESRKVDVFDASPTLENTDWDGLIVRVIKVTRATLVRRANASQPVQATPAATSIAGGHPAALSCSSRANRVGRCGAVMNTGQSLFSSVFLLLSL